MRKLEKNRLNVCPQSVALEICAVLAFALCVPQISLAQYTISTVAGGGPNNLAAAQASLGYPASVALDAQGNLYIANSYYEGQVLKVSTGGVVTVVAGNGTPGYSGDGGPATSAALEEPGGVFVDGSGNIFIADTENCVIREVSGGIISTVAGNPQHCGYGGDGSAPTSAQLDEPTAIFVDGQGNLYIADADNSVIRVVNNGSSAITIGTVTIQPGTIQTVAGSPGNTCVTYPCGDGGAASSALLYLPFGVSVDAAGNIYIADTFDSVIRVVNPGTQPVTIANTTIAGGAIEAVAGTYYDASEGSACQYGNGTATSAFLCLPFGLSIDGSGNMFIADYGNSVIREVVPAGTISTVAGTASTFCSSYLPPATACGNGGGSTATGAELNYPSGVTVDGSDNIYIADTNDYAVREVVQSSGNIQAFAGNGFLSYSGDGGVATSAELGYPGGTFVDASGNVYIADSVNSAIRVLNPGSTTVTINGVSIAAGDIGTVAGNGVSCATPAPGECGDGGLATSAQLNFPAGVFVDGAGNIYIADTGLPETENSVIRVVNPSSSTVTVAGVSIPANSIATVAGTLGSTCVEPAPGGCGDGGAATSAQLTNPDGVAVDGSGNIYIADTEDQAVRVVNTGSTTLMIGTVSIPAGDIATVAGTLGTDCTGPHLPCGDGGPAPSAYLKFPNGVALDSTGNIYIADTDDEVVRVVNPGTQSVTIAGTTIGAGDILTVAGTLGQRGYSGDSGAPNSALLDSPWGALVDSFGNIYIADSDNGAVREVVAATTTIQTIAGNGTPGFSGDGGAATSAELNTPQSVALGANNALFVADTENSRIRQLAPAPFTVTVSPSAPTVVVGALQQFTAAVTGNSNPAVNWSVNGVAGGNATVGTISNSGLFQAPATVPSSGGGMVTVTATSQVDNVTSGSSAATIANPSGTITVTVSTSPTVTQVYTCITQPCTPQPFIATVTGTSNTAVTWYVEGALGGDATYGTIDSSGNYTGPGAVPTQATITVEAVSQADATAIGTAQVTIVAAPSAPQPAPQTVSPGGTATYSFSLNRNTGVPGQAITLSCLQSSLPPGATCTFTPATITPSRNNTVPFALTVNVPSSAAALTKPSPGGRWAAPQLFAAFLPLAGILLLGGKGRRRWVLLVLAGICLLALVACGGGSSSTSTGSTSYTIAIQGTTTGQPNPVTITTASLTVE